MKKRLFFSSCLLLLSALIALGIGTAFAQDEGGDVPEANTPAITGYVKLEGSDTLTPVPLEPGRIEAPEFTGYTFQRAYVADENGSFLFTCDYLLTENDMIYWSYIGSDSGVSDEVASQLMDGQQIILEYEAIDQKYRVDIAVDDAACADNRVLSAPDYVSKTDEAFHIQLQTARGYRVQVTANGTELSGDSAGVYRIPLAGTDPGADAVSVQVTYTKVASYSVTATGAVTWHNASFQGQDADAPSVLGSSGTLTVGRFEGGADYTFTVTSAASRSSYEWRLNSFTVNGTRCHVPETYALGASAETTLPSGTQVRLELTAILGTSTATRQYQYTVTVSNAYEDIVINTGNFRGSAHHECMLYEAVGVQVQVLAKNGAWTGIAQGQSYAFVNSGGTRQPVQLRFRLLEDYTAPTVTVDDMPQAFTGPDEDGWYSFTVLHEGNALTQGTRQAKIVASPVEYRVQYASIDSAVTVDARYLPQDDSTYSSAAGKGTILIPNQFPRATSAHVFSGWAVLGTDLILQPGKTITLDELEAAGAAVTDGHFTFLAQWEEKQERTTVYYSLNYYTQNADGTYTLRERKVARGQVGQSITVVRASVLTRYQGEGYTLDPGRSVLSTTITDGTPASIDLYFNARSLTIRYAAGLGGTVSLPEETVSVLTPAAGSTARANDNWAFVGWYQGARKVSDEAAFTPEVQPLLAGGADSVTYTARFDQFPVITASDRTITVGDPFDPMAGVAATDREDGVLTGGVTCEGADAVDTSRIGTYTLIYSVTDSAGTTVRKTVTLTVQPKPTADYTVISYLETQPGVYTEHGRETGRGEVGAAAALNAADLPAYYGYRFDAGRSTQGLSTVILADGSGEIDLYYTARTVAVSYTAETGGSVSKTEERGSLLSAPGGSIAAPEDGWAFVGWYQGGVKVASSTQMLPTAADLLAQGEDSVAYTARFDRKPTITASDVTLIVGDAFDPLENVSADDAEDGDLTNLLTFTGTVDTSVPGTYHLTYQVTDTAGSTVVRRITVTVKPHPTADYAIVSYLADGNGGYTEQSRTTLHTEVGKAVSVSADALPAYRGYRFNAERSNLSTSVAEDGSSVIALYYDLRQVTIRYSARTGGGTDRAEETSDVLHPAAGAAALPGSDYKFIGWYEGDTLRSTDAHYTPDLDALLDRADADDFTFTARFDHIPAITAKDITLTVGDRFDPMDGVSADDPEDGDLTNLLTFTGTADTATPGTYSITYQVTDTAGSTVTRTITVTVLAPETPPTPDTPSNGDAGNSGGADNGAQHAPATGESDALPAYALLALAALLSLAALPLLRRRHSKR